MDDIDAQIDDAIRNMPASLCKQVLEGMYPAGQMPVEESVLGALPSSTLYPESVSSTFYTPTPQGVPFGAQYAPSVPGGQLAFGTLPSVPPGAPYTPPASVEEPAFGTIPNAPSILESSLPAVQRDILSSELPTLPSVANPRPTEESSVTQTPAIRREFAHSTAASNAGNPPVTFTVPTTHAPKSSQADWRSRNPNQPVIPPHSQGQNLTPAERSSQAKAATQRKLKQAELSEAVQDLLAEQMVSIDVIAQKHSVSVTKVKKLLAVGTNYKGSRTPSLQDALLHAKAQEVNSSALFLFSWTNMYSSANSPPHRR